MELEHDKSECIYSPILIFNTNYIVEEIISIGGETLIENTFLLMELLNLTCL